VKVDPRPWIAPAIGALVLTLVMQRTMAALHAGGTWQVQEVSVPKENPYAGLDFALAERDTAAVPGGLRDPFGTPAAPVVVRHPMAHSTPVVQAPAPAPAAPEPMLTAIIWDADPRATVHYDGRDFSVRENSLFADYTVKSIRPSEVVLDRNGQSLVLRLRKKGE
jgi:hypothetical protein